MFVAGVFTVHNHDNRCAQLPMLLTLLGSCNTGSVRKFCGFIWHDPIFNKSYQFKLLLPIHLMNTWKVRLNFFEFFWFLLKFFLFLLKSISRAQSH